MKNIIMLFICILLINCNQENKYKKITLDTRVSFPFCSTDNGWILIEIRLENEKKYLIFDTGSTGTFLSEKYISSYIVASKEIKDKQYRLYLSTTIRVPNAHDDQDGKQPIRSHCLSNSPYSPGDPRRPGQASNLSPKKLPRSGPSYLATLERLTLHRINSPRSWS